MRTELQQPYIMLTFNYNLRSFPDLKEKNKFGPPPFGPPTREFRPEGM